MKSIRSIRCFRFVRFFAAAAALFSLAAAAAVSLQFQKSSEAAPNQRRANYIRSPKTFPIPTAMTSVRPAPADINVLISAMT